MPIVIIDDGPKKLLLRCAWQGPKSGLQNTSQDQTRHRYQNGRLIIFKNAQVTMAPVSHQNLRYAIDFGTLPNLGGVPIEMTVSSKPTY